MAKGKIHVVPYNGGWAIRREGNSKASKLLETKNEAIEEARNMAWKNNEEVIVHNKKGNISKGKRYGKNPDDDNCFITTACIRHYNLTDNCYQLKTLRQFRDSYILNLQNGTSLIEQYYLVAPQIVIHLNQHPERNNLYKNLFEQINQACYLIEHNEKENAKNLYVKIISQLLNFFHLA